MAQREAAREELAGLLKSPAGQLKGPTPDAKPARAAIIPFPSVVKPLPPIADAVPPTPGIAHLEVLHAPVAPQVSRAARRSRPRRISRSTRSRATCCIRSRAATSIPATASASALGRALELHHLPDRLACPQAVEALVDVVEPQPVR